MFYLDPGVLYVSLHRYGDGFFPGTGKPERVGEGPGRGYNVNVAWSGKGAGDAEYLAAFDQLVMPVARAYAPELVLVSAGFDSAAGDEMGFSLTPAGYAALTQRLQTLAGGKVVVVLEGGYNVPAVARGLHACTAALLGAVEEEGAPAPPSEVGARCVRETADALREFWPCLRG